MVKLKKQSLFILFLIFFIFLSCVSKKQYLELESNYSDTQQRLEQQNKKLKEVEHSLINSEINKDNCFKDLSNLQTMYKDLKEQNIRLSNNLENLNRNIEKSKSIIKLQEKVITDLDETKKKITDGLKEHVAKQEIRIEELEGKLKVILIDKILFDLGSVEINNKGKKVLLKLANSLKEIWNQTIEIKGHTDNVSIGAQLKEKFPTNWELSTGRAAAVVRFLQENTGLEPERLSACGYSYYQPTASNDTEEERRQNRRIEIVLAPKK
jgi:chemotaxis protein MotB